MGRIAKKPSLLAFFLMAVLVIVTACSSSFTPSGKPPDGQTTAAPGDSLPRPANGLAQSSDENAVTIAVKWLGSRDGSLAFDVTMDTHSVPLDQYDLGKLATLLDDEGNKYLPVSWRSATGEHHRTGTLAFPIPDSLAQGKARYLQLVVRDVAGEKERTLQWNF